MMLTQQTRMGIVNKDYANSLNTNPYNMMFTQQTRMGKVNQQYYYYYYFYYYYYYSHLRRLTVTASYLWSQRNWGSCTRKRTPRTDTPCQVHVLQIN